ncbi:cytochrome c oxidase assembly protein subunit 11 [Thiothrix caldifontis]|uniref:Cytochrome c oxidase assembly protein CtaG n=1 Tax=Thiothrix caldifontis TaxID=525918 RepID=A0A1H4GEF4_9GAMM|nr:cytochrome c oxidase assembly protein [Thiothrix caldifontis]SEB07986.1 cytochrome c oxidase assembly protein subunit 11 [Thiothrix caldifontis]
MNDAPLNRAELTAAKNKTVTRRLFLVVLGMFGFGFAMVPLYRLACEVGGINGVAGTPAGRVADTAAIPKPVDTSRVITVQLDATVNTGLPWEFRPLVKQIQVHPGEKVAVSYYAKNLSDQPITGQAVPGITPWQVTQHFSKIECFCFTQQVLQPGEAKEMPVYFTIDPAVDKQYATVTLSYTFMNTERDYTLTPAQHAAMNTSH